MNDVASSSRTPYRFVFGVLFLLCMVANLSVVAQTATTTKLRGTLLGADAKPMKKAQVFAMQFNAVGEKPVSCDVSNDGSFELNLPYGWYYLEFVGVNHRRERSSIMYLVNPAATVKCTLASNAPESSIDSVKCITSMGKYDFDKQFPLRKQADGSWMVDLPIGDNVKEIGYQVILYAKGSEEEVHSINGTTAARYEYDGGGDYRSIVSVDKGVARIGYDPSSVPTYKGAAVVRFTDAYCSAAQTILEAQREDMTDFFTASTEMNDGKPTTWKAAARRRTYLEHIRKEPSAALKQLLMMSYLAVPAMTTEDAGYDPAFVDEIFSTISPASLVWDNYAPKLSEYVARGTSKSAGYIDRVLKENPAAAVKANILYEMTAKAVEKKQVDVARATYERLQADFPNTWPAQRAKRELNPSRNVRVGAPLPKFSFQRLDDSTRNVTNDDIKGRWVLIDNWATWCGPCVGEMGSLHAAYEKFKDRNFTILSVSFDRGTPEIHRFRSGKWPMPWMHSFSPGVWKNEAARVFEVSGIPKPILVSPDGTIVALDADLRGTNLETTLAKYLK